MRDLNLEKNIERLESTIERWKQLSQFLDHGFQQETIDPKEEADFLELKSQIARDYELLMTTLGAMSERDEKVLRLLNIVPSLATLRGLDENMGRKVAGDWHSVFIAMQALLGRLQGRKATLASVSTVRVGFERVFGNPLVILVGLVAAGYGIYKLVDEWVPKIQHLMEYVK